MTDREILAQLKKSYEYLRDIRENGCYDHCSGQMETNIDKLDNVLEEISDIYYDFYKTLNKKGLKIDKEILGNELYISGCVDGDYDVYEKNGNVDSIDVVTCGDIDYYWYDDEEYLLGDVDCD